MPKFPNIDKDSDKNPQFATKLEKIDDRHLSLAYFFEKASLEIESLDIVAGSHIDIYAHCSSDHGICPYCGSKSTKVHSRYIRHPKDLPMIGLPVHLNLSMRKFFCPNPECRFKTFAEQPANEIFWYRRRTRRCEVFVAKTALEVSSVSASSILDSAGIKMSHSTVRRDLRRMRVPDYNDVQSVGVDDWAMRKGVTYGSIIVSMQNGHPIDILGDREQESFKEWLEAHGNVQIVSRDRSTDYSAAIKATERDILEVADHFHLIMNMGDCVTDTIYENYSDYRNALRPPSRQGKKPEDGAIENIGAGKCAPTTVDSKSKRETLFAAVKEAQRNGMSINETARHLGVARQTVRKYFEYESLPPMNSKARNNYHCIDEFVEREFYNGMSKRDIFLRAVAELGFKGSLTPFYDHYRYLKEEDREHHHTQDKNTETKIEPVVRKPLITAKEISHITNRFIKEKELDDGEWELIDTMKSFEWFNALTIAAKTFYQLMKDKNVDDLITWIRSNEHSNVKKIRSFVKGLKMDLEAVTNCLIMDGISNGIVEGYVNKLKLVKRIMYGRASIQLLKVKMVMRYVLFN